jgi:acetyltransferase
MLDALFTPRSIAVIGASQDPKKVGHAVLYNLLRYNFGGRLCPINPSGGEILGLKAYPTVSAIGDNTDLAVIAVPARIVPGSLRECAAAGIKAAVVLSAGFKEAGKEGTRLEEELRTIRKESRPHQYSEQHERHLRRRHAPERLNCLLFPVRRHGHRHYGLGHWE